MDEEQNRSERARVRLFFETLSVARVLTEPLTETIESLLRVSARELNSNDASVIVRDSDAGDLRFLTAVGAVADRLKDIKIPAGKGIAGFVFSSGQPMALNNAGEDASFYREVDEKTGYSTETILATPLRSNGEIIGVLEYVNRQGGGGYTPEEMDKAALYADAVASLVNAFETANVFRALGEHLAETADKTDAETLRRWLAEATEAAQNREMLELALLVREISARGDAERRLCVEILQSVLDYRLATNWRES